MRRQHGGTSSTAILGRLALLIAPLLVATTAVGAAEAPDHGPSGQAIGASSADAADRLVPVGSLALPGFNADVWEHEGFAYVGTWGSPSNSPCVPGASAQPGSAPASSVTVYIATRPTIGSAASPNHARPRLPRLRSQPSA